MAKLKLKDDIKEPTIIVAHPGSGMIGSLIGSQMIEDMDFEKIGFSPLKNIPPVIAVRKGEMLRPMSILYSRSKNIILVFILAATKGNEWEMTELIEEIAKKTRAKKIVVPDGIAVQDDIDILKYSNDGTKDLDNGVIPGLTASILMADLPVECIFGNIGKKAAITAAAGIPSAKAAAKVIEELNKVAGLDLDPEKLQQHGENVEKELSQYMKQMKDAGHEQLSYIG